MKHRDAFSLIEVVLALGVMAFALVAILGLVPVALRSAKDAVEDTRVSLIAQDAARRSRALISSTTAATDPSTNWWYDVDGRFIDQSGGASFTNAIYRVTVVSGHLASSPANVTGTKLKAVRMTIGWPVDPKTGQVVTPANNDTKVTFPIYICPQ